MTDDDLPPLITTPPGLYRHYKGAPYEVLATVRHSETRESMTLYRALYGERGLWVPAIRPPTVPEGTARLRIALSASHTRIDVQLLLTALDEVSRLAPPLP